MTGTDAAAGMKARVRWSTGTVLVVTSVLMAVLLSQAVSSGGAA